MQRVMAALLLSLMGTVVWAETDPASAARDAVARLERASSMLNDAENARNRVKALTETVHAYEDGLQAMREGLRRVRIREETLNRELQSRNEEISQLLGVLQSIGQTQGPVVLLHPTGPLGTARSGMILADVTPALDQKATDLRERLEEVTILRELQESAVGTLREGLLGAQSARSDLSKAIADRTDLPRRFSEDPVKTALLLASTETLDGFASGLSSVTTDEVPGSLPTISDRKGDLVMPVDGRVLRKSGERDAAGIARPGIVVATRPHALVTLPAPATLRYRGPLLDYGNVAILEPEAGILLVFAGLDVVYGDTGEVLPGGSPLGLMGGPDTNSDALLIENGQDSGAERSQTLYIEVRENNTPVDPETWFLTDEG